MGVLSVRPFRDKKKKIGWAMSDTFNEIPSLQTQTRRAPCRVAYTLNNAQPVTCSIIGSQPLFYMDFEMDIDEADDMLFDDAELRVLEKEIASLKKEIDVFERFSGNFVREDNKTRALMESDMAFVTKREETKNEITIAQIEDMLGKSRMAAAEYAGMVKYGAQQAHLRTVNWRIPVYENVAANASTPDVNASTDHG